MAKKKARRGKSATATAAGQQPARPKKKTSTPATRRQALMQLAFYGGAGVLVAGGGAAFALDFRRKLSEVDLAKIGNGTPSVVQVHDPQCSLCQALQKQARSAVNGCDETNVQFLVANVKSLDGSAFAAEVGLPSVTLAFVDGAGNHIHTINGVTPAAEIKRDIARYFG